MVLCFLIYNYFDLNNKYISIENKLKNENTVQINSEVPETTITLEEEVSEPPKTEEQPKVEEQKPAEQPSQPAAAEGQTETVQMVTVEETITQQ